MNGGSSQWYTAMWWRLGFAVVSMLMIGYFPSGPVSTSFLILVILSTVLGSFASCVDCSNRSSHLNCCWKTHRTVQFVGISAFHTQIADPVIGGTYMTVSLLRLSRFASTS